MSDAAVCRYLRTCGNTVRLVYSMHSSTEHRKAPECGDEPDGPCWVDWGRKMMYHSSSPGLRQTQVHRSRQSHIRIRPAAGVRARTRGVSERRREGVVVHQSDSRCIVGTCTAAQRVESRARDGVGIFWWWRGGGARMAGLLISSGPLGRVEQPWDEEEVLFTVRGFDRPVSNLSVRVSVCPSLPPLRGNDCRMRYRPDRSD